MRHLNSTLSVLVPGLAWLIGINFSAAQSPDVIKKAMKDELARSMKELSLEGYQKPFFISYTLTDAQTFSGVATLGALARSSDLPSRQTAVRVLVGGYEFNDESLDDNLFSSPGGNEVPVPLQDDYYGIRRAFWGSTDEVYKSAAKQFERNQSTLKDQNKKLAEIPHRYLGKVPAVQLSHPLAATEFDRLSLEKLIRDLSAVFKAYPSVEVSGTLATYTRETVYFVNSEGTETQTSSSIASVQITAQSRTEKGEPLIEQLTFNAASPGKLLSPAEMLSEVKLMAERLMAQRTASAFIEDYSGPVLFLGQSVADLFANGLFSRENLVATNNIGNPNGYRFDSNANLDGKIGKKIVAEGLTVKAQSRLRTFEHTDLLGAFDIDDEGVAPPEEITLVENGVLKNLLNDRTITQADQTPNGHGAGPGVLRVTLDKVSPLNELKSKLIAAAKEEGLEFAIIVRDASMARMGLLNVYKVSVKDGREELARGVAMESVGLKSLRKLLGATSDLRAYNLQQGLRESNVVSWIVPEAVLVGEVELKESNLPYFKDEVYVQSPLK